ncbi:peptide chain release factor-like protein [Paramyrothecium foliicola]|nr:peptide chain release factor-like protein [Paramyrothecium foliicola]
MRAVRHAPLPKDIAFLSALVTKAITLHRAARNGAMMLHLFRVPWPKPYASGQLAAAAVAASAPGTWTPQGRHFSITTVFAKNLPPRPKPPPDSEIEESYLKGSGPGGQKINKTNSAVQLKHIPTGIVVKSQATRSRSQNRKHAREILAQKVDDLLNGDQSRSAIVGEVKKKRADSAAKKSRRKYRMLEEEQKQQDDDQSDQPAADPGTPSTTGEVDTSKDAPLTGNDKGLQ